MRNLPIISKKWLLFFVVASVVFGSLIDFSLGTKIDDWIHDAAVVYQARTEWKHTAIVVLDDEVPLNVSRQQSLPLFAKATERLINAGAKAVFLDARVSKDMETTMPFPICMESNGHVRWDMPKYSINQTQKNSCNLQASQTGSAPLKMNPNVFPYFRVAPFMSDPNLPNFLLFGEKADTTIPDSGLAVSDLLATKKSPINRWINLSDNHAILFLAAAKNRKEITESLKNEKPETCDDHTPCRPIRLSKPIYTIQPVSKHPIIPVSQLASCDDQSASQIAAQFKEKVVILQMTTPSEATDMLITPMSSAWLGPHLLTPGAQYLADAVETLINNDHPRRPYVVYRLVVFLSTALLSVTVGAFLGQVWLLSFGLLLFLVMMALCFFIPIVQLWPVSATLLTYLLGAIQITSIQMYIGLREGELITRHMPKQIHHLLLSLKKGQSFQSRRCQAIILVSDLKGYTSITSYLTEIDSIHLLELINDYLDATSTFLQTQYEAWLEAYVGDMMCYYWPITQENADISYHNALTATLQLAQLQKEYFLKLKEKFQFKIDSNVLDSIISVIDAGIGLSVGSVVMGDLGPKNGVKKFGILGDPINLAARLESLTRYFNTEIIVTSDFIETAKILGYSARRLGQFCVKGRQTPEMLYAIGLAEDIRFTQQNIDLWEYWLTNEEKNNDHNTQCPSIYERDRSSMELWKSKGLLIDGVWMMDEK